MSENKKDPWRPRIIKTPEEFNRRVDAYVRCCVEKDTPITWTGLALALGLSSREAIDNYLKYDGFLDSVKRAKLIVQNSYELRLHGQNATGAIFALKNFGWTDRTEITGANGADLSTQMVQVYLPSNGRTENE